MSLLRLGFLPVALAAGAAYGDSADDFVRSQMEKDHIPGVCFAVIRPGAEPVVRSYGMANLELSTPVTTKTVFRIASLSKQFCGYSILKAEKEGKLKLDNPITRFFPQQPQSWNGITVRHLLGHQSGLADPDGFDFTREYSPAEYLQLLAQKEPIAEPGTAYRYNTHGYCLLGLILEKVRGKPLNDVVTHDIFSPLGMSQTQYYDRESLLPNRADGYLWKEGRHVNGQPLRPLVYGGGGGVLTSMEDLLKYDRELAKQETLGRAILENQVKPLFPGGTYGAGWMIFKDGEDTIALHGGGTTGFTSFYLRNLTTGERFILLMNGSAPDPAAWMEGILAAFAKV